MGVLTDFRALFNEIVQPTEELPGRIIADSILPVMRGVEATSDDLQLRANQTFIEQLRIREA